MVELNSHCFGLLLAGLERYEAQKDELNALRRARAQKKVGIWE